MGKAQSSNIKAQEKIKVQNVGQTVAQLNLSFNVCVCLEL
jgi:hypothetical protein